MRTLLLLRHAKSSRSDRAIADLDRPLNARGRRDAPRVGRVIADLDPAPEFILCSPALRTRQTLTLAQESGPLGAPTRFDEGVYEATPGRLLSLIHETPDDVGVLLIVGHNPGMAGLVGLLTGAAEDMPTGALARLEFDTSRWAGVEPGEGGLARVWRPKDGDQD